MGVNKRSRNLSFRPIISDEKAFQLSSEYAAKYAVMGPCKRISTRQGVIFYRYDATTQKVVARHESARKWSKPMTTIPCMGGRKFSYNGHALIINAT